MHANAPLSESIACKYTMQLEYTTSEASAKFLHLCNNKLNLFGEISLGYKMVSRIKKVFFPFSPGVLKFLWNRLIPLQVSFPQLLQWYFQENYCRRAPAEDVKYASHITHCIRFINGVLIKDEEICSKPSLWTNVVSRGSLDLWPWLSG